jgi:uncharacterized membrane protein
MHTGFTPIILVHMFAAFAALGLGSFIFLRRKGDAAHRDSGRLWVGLMLATALSSFWIRGNGGFSWIHGLSVFTLATLALGIWLAASGNIARHRLVMKNLYVGALVITGLFTLMPQRLLGRALWGAVGLA